jgi:CRP-like cAMP-binding protein
LLKPLELYVGPGLHLKNLYDYSITAIQDSQVCFLDKDRFQEVLDTNRLFIREFLNQQQRNLSHAYDKMVTLNQRNARGRVADAILYMSEVHGTDIFDMVLSKAEVAQLAGASKESFYKVCNDFMNDNLVNIKGDVCQIIQKEILKTIRARG